MRQTSTLLIVDHQAVGREALAALLDLPEYVLAFAADGPEALVKAQELLPDLVLLEAMLPGMSGFEVCRLLRLHEHLAEVPIMIVTALDGPIARQASLEVGADDCVSKPFSRIDLRVRVRTLTRLSRYRRLLSERGALYQAHEELLAAYDATIEGWVLALDLRGREIEGHTHRVADKTIRLAQVMGVRDDQLTHMRRGALLHDVGKLSIPDMILLKPGQLTDDEWGIMRKHPQYAHDMLGSIPYLRPALEIPLSHHEKWDGTGYPYGLKGEEIPLAARIFAVVDVWDALRSDRIYRAGWPEAQVLEYIREQSGKHFDPVVVVRFLRMLSCRSSRQE